MTPDPHHEAIDTPPSMHLRFADQQPSLGAVARANLRLRCLELALRYCGGREEQAAVALYRWALAEPGATLDAAFQPRRGADATGR